MPRLAPVILLLLLVLAAHAPALRAGFVWDDDDYVTDNAALRSVEGLGEIWRRPGATPQYYPLVFTTFWVEHALWGLAPAGYHAVNLLLHAGMAVLLWRVLRRVGLRGAFLAAALFAVHPVTVESVAWVTERKNVLSGALYFAALLAYLRFERVGEEPGPQPPAAPRPWAWYALAGGLFALALLSKTVACSLPAAVLVILWWKRRARWGSVLPLLPLFVLGAGMAYVTVAMEHGHVGTNAIDLGLSALDRVVLAGRALWFYAAKALVPYPLTFIYPRWVIDAGQLRQWAYPLAAAAVLAGLWAGRKRIGRGPLAVAVLYAGALVPALGFIDVYPMRFSWVADHFQYLALPWILAGMAHLASRLAAWGCCLPHRSTPKRQTAPLEGGTHARAPSRERSPQSPIRHLSVLATGVVILLGSLTFARTLAYRDVETLWRDTLERNPACWLAWNNLGVLWRERGDLAESERALRRCVGLYPDYPEGLNNLGVTLAGQRRYEEALGCYAAALAAEPRFAPAHFNASRSALKLGRPADALAHLHAAVVLQPDDPQVHNDLGVLLLNAGQLPQAEEHLRTALALRSDYPDAHNNLGVLLQRTARPAAAAVAYRAALALRPGHPDAERNLAALLQRHPNALPPEGPSPPPP